MRDRLLLALRALDGRLAEAFARGARMLRTALSPAIYAYLEDPGIIEVMLNPDERAVLHGAARTDCGIVE